MTGLKALDVKEVVWLICILHKRKKKKRKEKKKKNLDKRRKEE
jgi:tRNA (Thr-GGU) A37 N-methylase